MRNNNTIKAMVVQAMKQETFTDIEYSFRIEQTYCKWQRKLFEMVIAFRGKYVPFHSEISL